MKTATLQINFERLKQDLSDLSEIGKAEDRGIYRMAFSPEDMKARAWLMGRIKEAGLETYQDGAANIFAVLPGKKDLPSVIIGSHIDTVPAAGHLDGTLGVLTGLEALRTIKEQGIETENPIEMVAFSDEEGRFGGLFGSQSFCGDITPEDIHTAIDLSGITLIEAMKDHGLDAMDALSARRNPETIARYLEIHIEQGPVLDQNQCQVGIVENITGLFKWAVRLIGSANHAGTTPMYMRKDSFQGLAEFSGEIPRILEEHGSENSRATIGRVSLFPGSANTVPGLVEFSLDVRDTDPEILQALQDAFRITLSAMARRRGLMFEFDILSEVKPVSCDDSMLKIIEDNANKLGLKYLRMPSGAAHDAQIMAKITPISMIFVPSKDGRSHTPSEWTSWEDIESGANLTLHSLIDIAGGQA